jgi:lysyl-tRNA synthetase class 2
VGGYEKVYEICKDFRNEGMDLSHNPEFTMIEFYEAYANYDRIMEVTEGMIKFCAKKIFGKEKLTVKGKKIDLSGSWPKITMVEVIKKELGLDVEKSDMKKLLAFCKKKQIEATGKESKGELIYAIFDHLIPSKLIRPTWVIDYPIEVSPLCKRHPEKEGWVERFEGYVGGEEICDGWSEVNDPIEQKDRFEYDQKERGGGKMGEEAHPVDEDFLLSLEYGMPTLGGIGIGVDRLTMFFTDTWSIKEVMIFPILRPKGKNKKKGEKK